MHSHSDTHIHAQRGFVSILIAALLWGTVGITTQAIYQVTPTTALSIGFLRLLIATPALLVACWQANLRLFPLPWPDFARMLGIGVTMALYQVCFLGAIPYIGVASTTLITLCTAPVIVALLAAVLLDEPLTTYSLRALGAALIGTVMLSWTDPAGAGERHTILVGSGLALSSALSYAIMTLCSRALAGRYSPLQPMTVGLGAGAVCLLPFVLASSSTISFPPLGWALLLYLGIVPTALAFVVFLMGMASTTATVASIITLIEPLTATVLAWLLFGERLSVVGLFGAGVLLGAIGLLYQGTTRQAHRSSTTRTPHKTRM
jgi:DME family drug/metabolite transporter